MNSKLEFKSACSFVNQLSDLYDEKHIDQLPPMLISMLDDAIEILSKNLDKETWVEKTLENAKYLRNNISEIKLFKHNL